MGAPQGAWAQCYQQIRTRQPPSDEENRLGNGYNPHSQLTLSIWMALGLPVGTRGHRHSVRQARKSIRPAVRASKRSKVSKWPLKNPKWKFRSDLVRLLSFKHNMAVNHPPPSLLAPRWWLSNWAQGSPFRGCFKKWALGNSLQIVTKKALFWSVLQTGFLHKHLFLCASGEDSFTLKSYRKHWVIRSTWIWHLLSEF